MRVHVGFAFFGIVFITVVGFFLYLGLSTLLDENPEKLATLPGFRSLSPKAQRFVVHLLGWLLVLIPMVYLWVAGGARW
jgi:hypothetical protein